MLIHLIFKLVELFLKSACTNAQATQKQTNRQSSAIVGEYLVLVPTSINLLQNTLIRKKLYFPFYSSQKQSCTSSCLKITKINRKYRRH